jgi:hypothetical protein
VARDRAEVVRFGLHAPHGDQVIADHAVQDARAHALRDPLPKDEYGREFESLLWQAVEARGARVVAVAGYKPTATDFAGAIARLLGPHAEAPAAPARPRPRTAPPPPLVDFDCASSFPTRTTRSR